MGLRSWEGASIWDTDCRQEEESWSSKKATKSPDPSDDTYSFRDITLLEFEEKEESSHHAPRI